jgi:hypothetical protein
MTESRIFQHALTGTPSIGWNLARLARERFPNLALLDGVQDPFNLLELARAKKCEASPSEEETAHFRTDWSRAHGLHVHPEQAVYDVRWRDHDLKVIVATWRDGFHTVSQSQVLAETIEIAREFVLEGCAFCNHPGDAIMRFQNGCWSKSHELWQMVQASSFEDLVLAGDLKERIVDDFSSFLAARAEYERYKVPHKRGVLLLGPPGNGKTHCLRALIKFLNVPCLYVMSLKERYMPEDACIDAVFTRARELTPCCLVFEDLDAMIHDKNRSYFLNQLDGISNASGLLTLATTNHPERLDPAIVDRPSRFDRKYHFDLPGETERRRYLAQWNGRLDADMRVTDEELDALARDTTEYSFAYLKELYLSSIMRWMSHRKGREMGVELRAQVKVLREQMKTGALAQAARVPAPAEEDGD